MVIYTSGAVSHSHVSENGRRNLRTTTRTRLTLFQVPATPPGDWPRGRVEASGLGGYRVQHVVFFEQRNALPPCPGAPAAAWGWWERHHRLPEKGSRRSTPPRISPLPGGGRGGRRVVLEPNLTHRPGASSP